MLINILHRCAPTIDLVLLSHGDLAHSGLYAYAYSHWNLNAPAYTTLPVQAMARIATTEDIESIREEQDVGDQVSGPIDIEMELSADADHPTSEDIDASKSAVQTRRFRYVATVQDVHEAFDSVNVLRYSQPCHLQGMLSHVLLTRIPPVDVVHITLVNIWI